MSPPRRLYRGRVADQIVDDLRRRILSGELADGMRLPSERELAAHYDVSAPTIREAVRVLTAMGLLNTRNGSRTTVTATGDALLRMSIASVVQFEKMRPGDVLSLLEVLNAHAAQLAAERASEDEINRLAATLELSSTAVDAESSAAALRAYWDTLSAISHNPLLAALCKAINEIQLGLASEFSGGDARSWRRMLRQGHGMRASIVEAIAARDAIQAADLVRDYHRRLIKRIQSSPRAKELSQSDPGLASFLTDWLDSHVSLENSGYQPSGPAGN